MRGVALGGFMGVGKTTVGRRLATALGLPFADLDALLEERFGPIPDQFAQVGEAGFRSRERALIRELSDGVPRVVATGGGAWVDPRNREDLGRHALTVVLSATVETLRERIGSDPTRPLWTGEAETLLDARSEAYADADLQLDAGTSSPDELVGAIVAALGRVEAERRIRVELGDRSYDVVIDPGGWSGLGPALDRVGVSEVAVVADARVSTLHGEAVRRSLGPRIAQWVEPAHGEANKTLHTWASIVDALLQPGFHRGRVVLALGGGVVGDLAGFASATAMRGVPFVQVPTTLLAMVDSSVGGKTGVNHPSGKNLVGAFHQPRLVWAPLAAIDTLPREELRAGLAEVLKTALIGDPAMLDDLETHGALLAAGGARDTLADLIARCVAIKADIVARDERESGLRAVLNLGHTVAHGLEAVLGGERIRHGEAVAIGLVLEARWAVRRGICRDADLPARIEAIARSMGLPTEPPVTERDAMVGAMRLDKKASSDSLSLPLPVRAGDVTLTTLPIDAIGELLDEAR